MEVRLQGESWEGICFDGNDTLCLAQFMQRMEKFPECKEKCVVNIQGRWTENLKPANPIGFPAGGYIKGYIRRTRITPISGGGKIEVETDAGGSNATFEKVAADKVSFLFFGIPKTWEKLVAATDFALHDVRMTKYHNDEELQRYVATRQYPLAIAVAKHLHNSLAAMTLVRYLHRLDQDADTMEKLTDAVRSLETLCQANKKWSYAATCALLKYIKSNINNESRVNSVIYAIEALGYVAPPSEKAREFVCESLSELLANLDKSKYEENKWLYWHIVWASLVVFERTTHPALRTEVIQRLKDALDDEKTLAEIEPEKAQKVVTDLMLEVIRLHDEVVERITPPPSPQPAIGPGRTLYILHLSDIHLGTQAQARNYLARLKTDLRVGRELEHPAVLDYLVVSGDISSQSTPEEYDAAYLLIDGLMRDYQLDRDRVVVVPGNHDLSWDLSYDAYKFYPAPKVPACDPDDCVQAGDKGTLIRHYPDYYHRFAHFSTLHNKIYGEEYPFEPEYQARLFKQANDKVVFLALNSCWDIDCYFCERSGICDDALNNALAELFDSVYDTWLKIAVWHHPVTGGGAMNTQFLQQIKLHGFQIGLHGHIHEGIQGFHYVDPMLNIRIIGAGTFGACVTQRVPGVPLQYNLIKYDPRSHEITVHSRKKNTERSSWMPDYLWDDGRGHLIPRYSFNVKY